MNKLIIPTIRNFILGVIVFGIMLFLPAWTLNYWQAWVFIMVFMILVSAGGVYFSIKDPKLIERRTQVTTQKTTTAQRIFIVVAFLADFALLVFSALDHRLGWSKVPTYVSLAGDLLVTLSFGIWYFVFKENSFAASTVQTFEEQRVITTGPYALVRHPLYVGVLVLIIGIPLALGSWWGLVFLALVVPGLMWRIFDEETVLRKDLPGYEDFTQKVRYRLIPYLW